jgi:hypothetical protein
VTNGHAIGRQAATEPRLGLLGDLVDELRWIATSRKGWLLGLAAHLGIAAVYVGYTHYDPHRAGDLRIANIGTAVVVWVLSNTINTNQSDTTVIACALRFSAVTACQGSSRSRTSRWR